MSVEEPANMSDLPGILRSQDDTEWHTAPLPTAQTISRNLLRERGGPLDLASCSMPNRLSNQSLAMKYVI